MVNDQSSNAGGDSFATTLGDALDRMGSDGRLSARDARAVRRALRKAAAPERAALLSEPETALGPFDSLPERAQQAVVAAVAQGDRWRLAGYDLGKWHQFLTSKIWVLRSKLPEGRLAEAAELLAIAAQVGPARVLHALWRYQLAWRGKFRRRPTLSEMFAAAGVETRGLAVGYARGIPQLPGYRGYWHDPSCGTTFGLIVGVDLIQNCDGYWYIESNLDCGLLPERTAMYESDPFVRNLLDFAAAGGYRRLVVVAGNSSVDPAMARQYKEGGVVRNLAVTLLEEGFHPRFGHEKNLALANLQGALVARIRYYRASVDYVVQHKRASGYALRLYKQHFGDSSFSLPETSSEPNVTPADPADPFPNLVFKFPERDKGEGIVFLKAASAAHARGILAEALREAPAGGVVRRLYSRSDDQRGIYQPYVRTPWLSDRRLYRTRAHVLLTPIGAHFLSAHRVVCSKPVPNELPVGVVRDPQPYLVNYSPGARFEVVPPEEEAAVRLAALGVARGLCWAISYGFETGPEGARAPFGLLQGEERVAASSRERS